MSIEKYFPLYSLGEILVHFKESVGDDFAATFGKFLGHTMITPWEHGDDVFVYKTEVHQEDEAIKTFLGKTEFIDGAYRRDMGLEGRWISLGKAIRALEELCDDCEIPTAEYKRKLKEINGRLK